MRIAAASLVLGLALARAAAAGEVNWIQDDFDKAVATAKEQKKLVHMNWWATW